MSGSVFWRIRGNNVERAQDSSMPISVQLIGNLRIHTGTTVLTSADIGGVKPRRIFEILLLQLGTPISKAELIETLWDGRPPVGATSTLESYVSVLRRSIQPGHTKTGPLRTSHGGYWLDPALVRLDLHDFERLVRQAERATPSEAYPALVQALELLRGPLLGDELLPEWAEEARARHAADTVKAKILAAETATALGRTDDAIRWAQHATATDRINERAWLALLGALEQAGRYTEGLNAYDRCRRIFDDDLGSSPGPALRAAHLRLLHQTADSDTEFSDVLSALLYLDEHLRDGPAPCRGRRDRRLNPKTAHMIVSSFLMRARVLALCGVALLVSHPELTGVA
jgi:DNA-binding SARP family transcriptional activator